MCQHTGEVLGEKEGPEELQKFWKKCVISKDVINYVE